MARGRLDYVGAVRLARCGQWRRWLRQPCPEMAGRRARGSARDGNGGGTYRQSER